MQAYFLHHKQIRLNLLEILNNTSKEILLTIPNGYNNNIYWNIAHCVATQQLLCYYLSNNNFRIDDFWIKTYKKGTFAKSEVSNSEIEELKFLLTQTSGFMKKDFEESFFHEYISYSTSFGIDLESIEDAILFNNLHESLHYGYILAQRRVLLF